MRIYHLSGSAVPSRTANSIQAMKMSAALASLGHEVTLFATPGHEAASADPHAFYGTPPVFDIVTCPWPRLRVVGSVWHAHGVMREVDRRPAPDLFYGRHLVSLAQACRRDRPVAAEVHLPPAHVAQSGLLGRIFNSPSFNRLLVISDALRAEYVRRFPVLQDAHVLLAPSAADPASPDGRPADTGGRPSAPRVGYVGHLYPGKGLEIITALAEAMPHVDFHVVGGTERDLSRWRASRSLENLRLHGHVPPGRLDGWMRAFDIAVAPYQRRVSVSGGGDAARWMSPLKIVEYMAYGKPIVASDLPPVREVIDDGVTGLLCAPDDPSAWRAAVDRLVADPALGARLGHAARRACDARYTWAHRARLVVA